MRGNMAQIFVWAAAFALPVSGQVARVRTSAPQAPYTAEYKITQTQRLADGNIIARESTEVISRDSEGRQLTTTKGTSTTGDQTPRTHFILFDSVARTNTSWSAPGTRAFILPLPDAGAARGCSPGPTQEVTNPAVARSLQSKPIVENLGTDTFNGVEAHGFRYTTTIAAGAIGNQEPIVKVREEWRTIVPNHGLGGLGGITVREKSDDPQFGTRTKELVSLEQREPDAAVFQVPSDYEIVKQTDTVTCQSAETPVSSPTQQ